MAFKHSALISILLIICICQSCLSVKDTCHLQTIFHKEVEIAAQEMINKDWDIAYYFSDMDCLSTINEVLRIPYAKSDYVDMGRRFIFMRNDRIVHQEIYWDPYYYRHRIPEFQIDTNAHFIVLYPHDRIKVCKQDEIFLLEIIRD